MKKRTLIAIGTVIGASALALIKTPQGKDIQKQLREKVEKMVDKSTEHEIETTEE